MILDDIVARKKITLEERRYCYDILEIAANIKSNFVPSFYEALAKDGLSIIGEVKKASPSRGVIKEDFNPVDIAKQYSQTVDAISVLTEEHYFMGNIEYLDAIKKEVKIPLLRKDFIIAPSQIVEARAHGASAVLFIAAILNNKLLLKEFLMLVHSLKMYALVETHNEEELELAIESGAKIIGINNRNLYDFSEDINTTARLSKQVPRNILLVSESSIHTEDDIKVVRDAGVDAVLVGESFMRCDDIAKKAEVFRKAYECRD